MSQMPDQQASDRERGVPRAATTRWGVWLALVALIGGLSLLAVVRQDPGSRQAAPPPEFSGESQQFIPSRGPRPAPQTAFTDGDGRPLTLAETRGKVALVNFWATWCVPCVTEMAALDRLQGALGGEGLVVLALSQDRGGLAVVRPFYDKLGLTRLGVYLDPTAAVARDFGVQALPVTVILDRQGREVGRLTGPAAWDSEQAMALIRYYLTAPGG